MILVFDTETTGKADFKASTDAPQQPHIVQLGAILFDDQWNVRHELNAIIEPDGWVVPDEVAKIHGITHSIAVEFGVPLYAAMSIFQHLLSKSEVVVAHNLDFDALVVAANHARLTNCFGMRGSIIDKGYCTMQAMTPICRLPGSYGDFKWPRLQEAYKHAFNEEFDGAHDAMADVRACARVYRWITETQPKEKDDHTRTF